MVLFLRVDLSGVIYSVIFKNILYSFDNFRVANYLTTTGHTFLVVLYLHFVNYNY